jgi:hypothetical protein
MIGPAAGYRSSRITDHIIRGGLNYKIYFREYFPEKWVSGFPPENATTQLLPPRARGGPGTGPASKVFPR